MSLVEDTVRTLNVVQNSYSSQSYFFRAKEGTAVIGANDIRYWEFFGDRYLALTLRNSKILHLTYPDEQERHRQMYDALEWWAK